jgi:hypothetical protein
MAVAAVVATVVAVAGVSVGGFVAFNALSGGGDQPEKHLPGTAVAIAKIDLDPSAGQKIDAIRFARKFPVGKGLREDGDPRQWLWEKLTKDVERAPSWSSAEQWMGDRAAVAVLPRTGSTTDAPVDPVLLLAVTDPAKAKTDLSAFPDSGVAVADGWAYVARTADVAQAAMTAARTAPLTDNATFAADMDRLGEDGVAAFWYDGVALAEQLKKLATTGGLPGLSGVAGLSGLDSQVQGHGAFALRFSGADLELAGTLVGASQYVVKGKGSGVEHLPAGTLGAVGIGGLGSALSDNWSALLDQVKTVTGTDPQSTVDEVESRYGFTLPADLVTLLGDTLAIGVAGPGSDGVPVAGARVETNGANLAALVERLQASASDAGVPVATQIFGRGYTIASEPVYAKTLTGTGSLGSDKRFTAAAPDAAGAAFVTYADVQGLVKAYGDSMSSSDRADIAPLEAFGMTITVAANGDASLRLKVTTR